MTKIANCLTDLIGNTPLLHVGGFSMKHSADANLLAKLECFNPLGSAKDRVALSLITAAEEAGQLKRGAMIVEPTSGNTGVGLAWIAAVRGYKTVLTMPDTMSSERINLLKALGAQVVLTPGAEGMKGAIAKAEALIAENPGSFMPAQFDNPANPAAHVHTTAEEIWRDTDGKVDIFVAGVGTGGTITGTSRGLKAHNPKIYVVGVEPATSAVLSGRPAGPHGLQGIGAGFIPRVYDASVVDEVIAVSDDDAMRTSRELSQTEGLLVGISSGAAVWAALQLAKREENRGKNIVVLLPDTGERYLSTKLFAYEDHPL